MIETLTISAAAFTAAHFVAEHALSHTVGGEAHHLYREFLMRWREGVAAHPQYQHLEEASEKALRAAALVLVMELGGRVEPQKSRLTRWIEKQPGGGLLALDLFPGTKNAHAQWLDALRKAIRSDRFQNLHRYLKLDDECIRHCFDEGSACRTLSTNLADAFLEWSRFELKEHQEYPDFELVVREGWSFARTCETKGKEVNCVALGLTQKGVSLGRESAQHITLAQTYCLFLREYVRRNPEAFRILAVDTLNEIRSKFNLIHAEPSGIGKNDFDQWLRTQASGFEELLNVISGQIEDVVHAQQQLDNHQSEILAAIVTLNMEVSRGTAEAAEALQRLRDWLNDELKSIATHVSNTERNTGLILDELRTYGHEMTSRIIDVQEVVQRSKQYHFRHRHQLRPISAYFTGRSDELTAIVKEIQKGQHPGLCSICTLNGMGGIGKTELAIAAGHALSEQFPEAHLMIELATHSNKPRSTEDALRWAVALLSPDSKLPTDLQSLRAAYIAVLHGTKTLVILDDVRDEDQVDLLLPPAGCAVIVTSRKRLSLAGLPPLEILRRSDSTSILQQLCARLDQTQAQSLAELCVDLPIALQIAGRHLSIYRTVQVSEYIAELSGTERIRRLKEGHLDVSAVFAASYRALSIGQQTAFRLLSIMPADFSKAAANYVVDAAKRSTPPQGGNIHNSRGIMRLFDQLFGRTTSSTNAPGETDSAVDELVALNLINYDEQSDRLRWHELLREFAHGCAKIDELEAAHLRHALYFTEFSDKVSEFVDKGGHEILDGLKRFDAERQHFEAAFLWLDSELFEPNVENITHVKIKQSAKDSRLKASELASLVSSISRVMNLRFTGRQSIRWLKARASAAHLNVDLQTEGDSLAMLGQEYLAIGEPRHAVECFEKQLKILRKFASWHDRAVAWGRLGDAYLARGDPRKAMEAYQEALTMSRKHGDKSREAEMLFSIGDAHKDLKELSEAIESHKQALKLFQQTQDQYNEAVGLSRVASAYADLKEFREAEEYYQQSLAIARRLGSRRLEGHVLSGLASVRRQLGDIDTCIRILQDALLVHREVNEQRAEQLDLSNLARAYAARECFDDALEAYEQVLVIHRKLSNWELEAIDLFDSAILLYKKGRRLQAIQRAEEAWRTFELCGSFENRNHVHKVLLAWREEQQTNHFE